MIHIAELFFIQRTAVPALQKITGIDNNTQRRSQLMGDVGKETVLCFIQLFQFFHCGFQILGTSPHQQFQMLLVLPDLGCHQPDQRREKHKTKQTNDHGLLPVIFHNAGKLVFLQTEADISHQIAGIVLYGMVNKQMGNPPQIYLTGIGSVIGFGTGNGTGFLPDDPAPVLPLGRFGGNMNAVHRQHQKTVGRFRTDIGRKVIITVADTNQHHAGNDLAGIARIHNRHHGHFAESLLHVLPFAGDSLLQFYRKLFKLFAAFFEQIAEGHLFVDINGSACPADLPVQTAQPAFWVKTDIGC